ncbi:hypothetical protein E2320_007861, partial [Naja naja]
WTIVLVVNNCHPQMNHLTNVKLKVLPPNITTKIQTLDQGIKHSKCITKPNF